MLHILLVTERPNTLHPFTEALRSDPQVQLDAVRSGTEALQKARASTLHLMVIDSPLTGIKPLDLIRETLMVNAMVNTAVVSPLSEEEFHEENEGLGVLARLPMEPGRGDAVELLRKLRQVAA